LIDSGFERAEFGKRFGTRVNTLVATGDVEVEIFKLRVVLKSTIVCWVEGVFEWEKLGTDSEGVKIRERGGSSL